MIFDQIASQQFTLEGKSLSPVMDFAIQRRRELHKLFYTAKQKAAPEPIVQPEKPEKPEITPAMVTAYLDRKLPKAPKAVIFTDENGREWIHCASIGPLEQIKREVAEKHGVTVSDMESKFRHQKLMPARREYCYRARTETLHSLPFIGRHLGDRDHTTVLNSIKRHIEIMGLQNREVVK